MQGIDANEDFNGGAGDFQVLIGWLVDHLPTPGPVDASLGDDYPDAEPFAQTGRIETLLAALETDRSTLVESWGADWYERVVEVSEIDLASIDGHRTADAPASGSAGSRGYRRRHLIAGGWFSHDREKARVLDGGASCRGCRRLPARRRN